MTNHSLNINLAFRISGTFIVMLVLNACSRPLHQTVGHEGFANRRLNQAYQGARYFDRIDEYGGAPRYVAPDEQRMKPIDDTSTQPTHRGTLVATPNDVGPTGSLKKGDPLPWRPLFNPDEVHIKETEYEARLRRIMRICIC
jgi:hypothetical protein